MKKKVLRLMLLFMLLGSASIANADPRAGLWEVTSNDMFGGSPYTSKYQLCIQQGGAWYKIFGAKLPEIIRKYNGIKGKWSSNGPSHMFLGINPNGTISRSYALDDDGPNRMAGASWEYNQKAAAHQVVWRNELVQFNYQGITCPPLTY